MQAGLNPAMDGLPKPVYAITHGYRSFLGAETLPSRGQRSPMGNRILQPVRALKAQFDLGPAVV